MITEYVIFILSVICFFISIGMLSVPNTLSFIIIKIPMISFCVITGFYMAKKVGWL